VNLLTPLLVIAALAALGGVGFAVLVQASPLGLLPFKPFACRTCLSGWGSIATCAVLLLAQHPDGGGVIATLCLWATLSFAGTGGAHLLMGIADGPGGGDLQAPLFDGSDGTDGAEPESFTPA